MVQSVPICSNVLINTHWLLICRSIAIYFVSQIAICSTSDAKNLGNGSSLVVKSPSLNLQRKMKRLMFFFDLFVSVCPSRKRSSCEVSQNMYLLTWINTQNYVCFPEFSKYQTLPSKHGAESIVKLNYR